MTNIMMTTPIGLQPVDSTGMRALVDALNETFAQLDKKIVAAIKEETPKAIPNKDALMTTPIGMVPINTDGMRCLADMLANAMTKLDGQAVAKIKAKYMYNKAFAC